MVYGFSEDKSKSDLLDFFYPVGSYYETSDSTFDPNSSWGGYGREKMKVWCI